MKILEGTPAIVDIDAIREHPRNPRQGDVGAIYTSIDENGFYGRCLVQRSTGYILAGNHRWKGAKQHGAKEIPVEYLDVDDRQAMAILLADNKAADHASYNTALLAEILKEYFDEHGNFHGTLYDGDDLDELLADLDANYEPPGDDEPEEVTEAKRTLAQEFIVPPFTILDGRQGYWQDRKRAWIALGIKSDAGRGTGLAFTAESAADPQFYQKKRDVEARLGHEITTEQFLEHHYEPLEEGVGAGTSIFDPVLAECLISWFSPVGGTVLDPFAGGSVRGAVSALLGRPYNGIDLRPEQVDANRRQWETLNSRRPRISAVEDAGEENGWRAAEPSWHVGDARDLDTLLPPEARYDLLLSCPPYGDLEKYGDDPRDLSNAASYAEFLEAYRAIIAAGVRRLRPNRFAAWVVGEIRDPRTGYYRGFINDTIAAFEAAGARFYNEGIFVTPAGSLPIRAGRQFAAKRKLGKSHQNALVFYKGDPREERTLEEHHHKVLTFYNGDPDTIRDELGDVHVGEALREAEAERDLAALADGVEEL